MRRDNVSSHQLWAVTSAREADAVSTLLPAEDAEASDVARLVAEASGTANSIETRVLKLVKEAARGTVAADDFSMEILSLVRDLQRCYRHLAEAEDRRDLSFRTMGALDELRSRFIWLYRKMHLEQAFYMKLELETRLRSLISTESYALYQRIVSVDDSERGFLCQNDADLRRALLGTS